MGKNLFLGAATEGKELPKEKIVKKMSKIKNLLLFPVF